MKSNLTGIWATTFRPCPRARASADLTPFTVGWGAMTVCKACRDDCNGIFFNEHGRVEPAYRG
jgi:hypothetical protein